MQILHMDILSRTTSPFNCKVLKSKQTKTAFIRLRLGLFKSLVRPRFKCPDISGQSGHLRHMTEMSKSDHSGTNSR